MPRRSAILATMLFICLSVSSPYAALSPKYFGYHVENDTIYAVYRLNSYTEMFFYTVDLWHYRVNDTIWSDTGGYVVTGIDTAANKSTLDTIGEGITGRLRPKELVGLQGNGTVIFDRSIIRIVEITRQSVKLRFYKVPHEKMFLNDQDTIHITDDTITGVHVYEDKMYEEECRDIFFSDIHTPGWLGVYSVNGACGEARVNLRISSEGISLITSVIHEYSAAAMMDTLSLTGEIDSSEVTLNIGEQGTVPYDGSVVTPVWLMNEEYSMYARAAGFRLVEGGDVPVHRPPSVPNRKENVAGYSCSHATVNLLGRMNTARTSIKPMNIRKIADEGKQVILR
ncbi:MAG: hypothetical protein JW863_01500 [Chitinispirillaceae bacterium]|nr:hypothetical protein [Chitinispirillaceae bacterium]